MADPCALVAGRVDAPGLVVALFATQDVALEPARGLVHRDVAIIREANADFHEALLAIAAAAEGIARHWTQKTGGLGHAPLQLDVIDAAGLVARDDIDAVQVDQRRGLDVEPVSGECCAAYVD